MATIQLATGGISLLKSDTTRAVSDSFASVKNVNDLLFSCSELRGCRKKSTARITTQILAVKSSEPIQSADKSSNNSSSNKFPSRNGPATTFVSSPSLNFVSLHMFLLSSENVYAL